MEFVPLAWSELQDLPNWGTPIAAQAALVYLTVRLAVAAVTVIVRLAEVPGPTPHPLAGQEAPSPQDGEGGGQIPSGETRAGVPESTSGT